MGASSFNEMELDAIGEIMNISLGASATAVSTMLGTKVNITTPVVLVQTKEQFEFKRLEPAIGVEISYVEGLEGKNIMMFRKEDIRIIVSTMMGGDIPEAEFEMDELYVSAICEVMNQMMGSSATALSEFLGTVVNISTPKSFDIGEPEEFKNKYFIEEDGMVVVRFRLEIEDKLNSEFMNIMPRKLAKRLLEPFADSLGISEEPAAPEPEPVMPEIPEPAVQPAPEPQVQAVPEPAMQPEPQIQASPEQPTPAPASAVPPVQPMMQPIQPMPQPADPAMQGMQQPYYPYPSAGMDPMMLQLLNQMQQTQMQMMEMMKNVKSGTAAESTSSNTGGSIIRPLTSPQIQEGAGAGEEDKTNQEMLMKVPLEVSVEIGRTKRLVKDILEFTQGTLVVLDKMAGEQVDLFVNGQCIAKGDIVVVEDNFGIRVTEIVTRELNPESL